MFDRRCPLGGRPVRADARPILSRGGQATRAFERSFHAAKTVRTQNGGAAIGSPVLMTGAAAVAMGPAFSVVPYLVLMTVIRLFAMIFWPSADGWTPSREKAVPKVFVGANDGNGTFLRCGRPP